MSAVNDFEHPTPEIIAAYYQVKLAVETDCADVWSALQGGQPDFILLHVIGTEADFLQGHIPGALHLPVRNITPQRLAKWPHDALFVVYCAGPHCNGADRAALKIAQSGRAVKVMLGGLMGWRDEGFTLARQAESNLWDSSGAPA